MDYNVNFDIEKLKEEIGRDEFNEIIDIIENIVLVRNMVSKDRKRAKDLERDEKGRIIVDLENPHILEDMDYFRQAAIHYQKYGRYTDLVPNSHPNSEYARFWREEARRCREGYVRESDGEWIPGYYYFYLNYSPILLVEDRDLGDGDENIRAERVRDFPKVWDGDYLFFHYVERGEAKGLFGTVLKARGRGYSFKLSSMAIRNMLFFKESKSYLMAYETEFLLKDGIVSKAWALLDWLAVNTPFPKARLVDKELHKRLGYVESKDFIEKGMKSEVIGVSLKDNPGKARGKRGKLIAFEESGIFPGLLKAWKLSKKSMKQGRVTFGYMISFGTGGEEGSNFEAAEELFYNPEAYDVLPMRNIYDKVNGEGVCGFFVPEYLNRAGCYDSNGNSDVIKALKEILMYREKIRKTASDPNALVSEKAESPITPQEAVLRREGSVFPVLQIKEYLSEIMPSFQSFVSGHWVGNLTITSTGELKWVNNADLVPIREFPIKDNKNKEGAIEIYEMPITGADGGVPHGVYIGGIDTIDDDESTTNSLFCIYIMNVLTDRIVAEYIGRTNKASDSYEKARRLLMFYNAVANYENDKKGLYAYFKNKNSLHLLCDTPEILRDLDISRAFGVGNKSKGTNSSKKVNAWARRLSSEWMLSEAYKSNPDEPTVLNLHKIRSVGLLKEAAMWNPDGNFDRISALGMLMILREEMMSRINKTYDNEVNEFVASKFFKKHYDKNHVKKIIKYA
jgi:hypothetical protein